MSSATEDLSSDVLDQHLHLLADPCLCSLADQLVRQIRHPRTSGRDLLRRMPPIEPDCFGTLLG
jgi:Rod binding domain-containing protein